jgi:alpha-D-ribose 1-methylphosphonate 5-triphosphate synthase subunit PhnH
MDATALHGGFADAPRDAAHAFRAAMQAMARPGRIERIAGATPPAPLSPAAGALLLTLCDPDAGVHLAGSADTPGVRAWLAFHTGAPVVGRAACRFAVGRWTDLAPLDGYPLGTPDYPDRSATLIVELDGLAPAGARLTGPGIDGAAALSLPEIDAFLANARAYPCGLDFFFTCGDRLAALPRSARVSEGV